MHLVKKAVVVLFFVSVALAQSPEPPLSDTRLTIHTLLREDIFSGFLADDMERFARGEKNIQLLMEKRPDAKAELLAWKGGAALYRAVHALETKHTDEFQKYYRQALDSFAEANKLGAQNGGVAAVTGGSYVVFADRLPKEYRAAAWTQAYDSYRALYKQQSSMLDKLPVHLKGEMLGGLAQSAQRTGHSEEAAQYVDKILEILPNTPYEPVAKKWKANPESAAKTSITCMTCHDGGRLASRIAVLNGK
jgi:tetratricopeptide (TPR) repeat protein